MPYLKFSYFLSGSMILICLLNSCQKDYVDNQASTASNQAVPELKDANLSLNSQKAKELLGKNIFFDKISKPATMSCASCHAPEVGFTGPTSSVNAGGSVYQGAVKGRFGNRRPPSAAYAAFSPVMDLVDGDFIGGNFWDGRATGLRLGNPSAEQALGPFENPVEHNTSRLNVLKTIEKSNYADLWRQAWGSRLKVDEKNTDQINSDYDKVGLSIAAFEASKEVSPFSSKFDYYLKGEAQFTKKEKAGMDLFNGKGNCFSCHISSGNRPLFTDFTYDNLGVPKNLKNPASIADPSWTDPGLGGFLSTLPDANPWKAYASEKIGKHKVPTLRNVDKRPDPGFVKSYMHNGVFKSLKEVVHFYNTRDIKSEKWPAPEVSVNVNPTELGNLGLTDKEEDEIVAFMKTLSDGYR